MKYNINIAHQIFYEHGYILDETKYKNTITKMLCHDKDGLKYETDLASMLTGRKPLRFSKFNKYTLENIQTILDKETDGVILLSKEYINNRHKMRFQCSCGKEFEMNIFAFMTDNKRYCNYCAKSKRFDSYRNYYQIIKDRCDLLNYKLLTKDIKRCSDYFDYICLEHSDKGIQHSNYNNMIYSNQGCKYCGIESRGIKHRISREDIIKTLKDKNFVYVNHDYIKRTPNSSSKVRIHCICNNHPNKGIQYLDYYNLKNNKIGCIYCAGKGRTMEDYQKELNDNRRDITILQYNGYSNMIVKCDRCGQIWETSGANLTYGHGCPSCNKSNYEKMIENILIDQSIEYIPQYKFDGCKDVLPLPFDFYLPQYKTLIEVDGQGHYMPINFGGISDEKAQMQFEKTHKHDLIKTQYCVDNNYNLLRIPYFDLDNKDIDMEKYIINAIS